MPTRRGSRCSVGGSLGAARRARSRPRRHAPSGCTCTSARAHAVCTRTCTRTCTCTCCAVCSAVQAVAVRCACGAHTHSTRPPHLRRHRKEKWRRRPRHAPPSRSSGCSGMPSPPPPLPPPPPLLPSVAGPWSPPELTGSMGGGRCSGAAPSMKSVARWSGGWLRLSAETGEVGDLGWADGSVIYALPPGVWAASPSSRGRARAVLVAQPTAEAWRPRPPRCQATAPLRRDCQHAAWLVALQVVGQPLQVVVVVAHEHAGEPKGEAH